MLDVANVRLGLATNSSSSHSIVFVDDPDVESRDDRITEFGWDFWTASARETKMAYLGLLLEYALTESVPLYVRQALQRQYLGTTIGDTWSEDEREKQGWEQSGNIDHQSLIGIPREFNTQIVDGEFLMEMIEFFARPDVVIVGGNDNTAEHHDLLDSFKGEYIDRVFSSSANAAVCRKDGDYWTLFNEHSTGHSWNPRKVRFRFPRDGEDVKKTQFTSIPDDCKLSAPELVDLKITDMCPYGCPYCYQASTPEGEVEAEKFSMSVIDVLGKLKVFEVAIGGGEPTLAPHFKRLLHRCRRNGIVPNFTTRNLAWLDNHADRDEILEHTGAFAYSVDFQNHQRGALAAIKELVAKVRVYNVLPKRVYVQMVLGPGVLCRKREDLLAVADLCGQEGLPLTLLGYKATGFGQQYIDSLDNYNRQEPQDRAWWAHALQGAKENKTHKIGMVGIDTVLAAEAGDAMINMGIPGCLYRTVEGGSSCYIDAVTKKMGPSSYCESEEMKSIDDLSAYDEKGMRIFTDVWNSF